MTSDNIADLNKALDGSLSPNLPPTEKMLEFGMEILKHSSIGMELVMFAMEHKLDIKIITGREETSYAPNPNQVVICLESLNPAQPARFILLLAGAIRESMQIHAGMTTPNINEDMAKILEKTREKHGDRVAYMCAVAYEINLLSNFTEYNILEELKGMGYADEVAIFLKNV